MDRRPLGATPSSAMDAGLPGRRLSLGSSGQDGELTYTLIRALDRGGMGELFVATLSQPGQPPIEVAVKRLLAELVDDENYVAMFRSEAEVMGQLDHPNIVRVYDTPVIDGSQCLAMEYVRGKSAQQMLARCEQTQSLIPPAVVLRIMADILRGLDYAHNFKLPDGTPLNLVHRDVSPGNLLVGFDGHAKLTDFGISKSRMSAVSTTVGIVKGKARYLSPEQILGEGASPRSDIFSAAAVTAELLTGKPTFDKTSVPKTLYAIVNGERVDLEQQLDFRAPLLVQTLNRALASNPRERLATAAEFAEALEASGRLLGGFGPEVVADFLAHLFDEAPEPMLEISSGDINPPEPNAPVTAEQADQRRRATELIERRRPPPSVAPVQGIDTIPDSGVISRDLPEGAGPTAVTRAKSVHTRPPSEASVDEALSVLAWLQARQADKTAPTPSHALSGLVGIPTGATADLPPTTSLSKSPLFKVGMLVVGVLGGIGLTLALQSALFPKGPEIADTAPPLRTLVATSSVTEVEDEEDLPPLPPLRNDAKAFLDILHPKGAKVRIDGRAVPGRVPIRGLVVSAGKRKIRIVKGRYSRELVLDLEDGEQMVLNRPRR